MASRPPPGQATILHVDMDAFFAAVEVLEDPSLAGKPVIVGGGGDRGVVASCSYQARAYGVRSAMPSVRARRLCPQAVFVPGRYDLYAEYSHRMHQVFASVTPVVEGIALDEAFLDVAGAVRVLGNPADIAHVLRQRLADDTGLTASVGVATCKLIAKLASEAAKPTATLAGPEPGLGVKVVEPGEELAFLHPHPVSALWGVGPTTARRLQRFGVSTVGDLAALPRDTLVTALGPAAGRQLHDLSWARDDRVVEPDHAPKSIGHEETYAHDLLDSRQLHREAVRLADAVAHRLRAAGLAGRTVTVKVRFHDFSTITRSQTAAVPVDTGPEVAAMAAALVGQVDPGAGVRLLGVSASNFSTGRQLSLDDALAGGGWTGATDAVDAVRRRFGEGSIGPAVAAGDGGLRVKRRGDQQWGPDGDRP